MSVAGRHAGMFIGEPEIMDGLDRWGTCTDKGLIEFDNVGAWDGEYRLIQCKRALSPSRLPEMDYALNPYAGCEHGCVYCYAPEVTHSDPGNWRVVGVKTNIVERMARELPGLSGTIGIGTVTDPYQAAEARFMLTRRCLEHLVGKGFPIHLHTKSDLILRDLDLLKRFEGQVAITLTTCDDRLSRITEPGAPLPEARFGALKALTDAGINTYALIAPVLDRLEGLEEEFCRKVADTGVRRVALDRLNIRPVMGRRLDRMGIGRSDRVLENLRTLLENDGIQVRDVFPRSS